MPLRRPPARRSAAGEIPGELPWRDRMLDHAAVFAVGLAAATGLGLVVGVLTAAAVAPAIGYTIVAAGVIWMFAGGMSGGGYSVLGIGKGAGRYTYAVGDGNEPLLEELRRGYRPGADPIAFGQVVVGVLYAIIGVAVIVAGS